MLLLYRIKGKKLESFVKKTFVSLKKIKRVGGASILTNFSQNFSKNVKQNVSLTNDVKILFFGCFFHQLVIQIKPLGSFCSDQKAEKFSAKYQIGQILLFDPIR